MCYEENTQPYPKRSLAPSPTALEYKLAEQKQSKAREAKPMDEGTPRYVQHQGTKRYGDYRYTDQNV
jgi:hypothetical protein